MPAYNAERTLKSTLDDLPRDSTSEIILVDDGSRDDTVALAKSLGLKVFLILPISDMAQIKKPAIQKH